VKRINANQLAGSTRVVVDAFVRALSKLFADHANAARERALDTAKKQFEAEMTGAPEKPKKPRVKRKPKAAPVAAPVDRRAQIADRAKAAASAPVERKRRAPRCGKCGAEGFRSDGCGRTHNVARMDIDETDSDAEDEPAVQAAPVFVGDSRQRRRNPEIARPKAIAPKKITRAVLAAGAVGIETELSEIDALRPKTRAECVDGPRPCPWVSCKHHLALDINEETGSIKLSRPDLEVWEMPETCALDIADRGEHTLEQVGAALNVTRERLRQIETKALLQLRAEPAVDDIGEGPFCDRGEHAVQEGA
jgi:hypothetical protein